MKTMRNKYTFKEKIKSKCPKCGLSFYDKITVEFVTNHRGDIIEHKIKQYGG